MTDRRLVGYGAVVFPVLHTLTDMMEWAHGGFSSVQLWLNYLAFLPVPAVLVGLAAVQRPRLRASGLAGALLYGFAFVYFAHTTLAALETDVPTYAQLWDQMGSLYTLHGAIMIAGGAMFAWATARAGSFPRWTVWLFASGLALNGIVAMLPVPELWQTVGTLLRNAGLAGMGWSAIRQPGAPTPSGAPVRD